MPVAQIDAWREASAAHQHLNSPFLSFEFCSTVAEVHPLVFVAAIRRAGKLVALLPFQFSGFVAKTLRIAERVGGDMSDHFGPLKLEDFSLSPNALLRLLNLNAFEFKFLSSAQDTLGLSGDQTSHGLVLNIGLDPKTWWAKLKLENKDFVSQLDRRERKLASEFGPVRYTFEVTGPNVASELTRLIDIKRQQYARTKVRDPLKTTWKLRLLRELAAKKTESLAGALSTLHAGETWLASHLGLVSNGMLHQWFPVYNQEFSRFSPGHLLTKRIILGATDGKFSRYDLGSDAEYKRHFRPEIYVMSNGCWELANVSGTLHRVARSLEWRLKSLRA